MAVHNLSAEPLVVTKWRDMTSFPRDGSMVEVLCEVPEEVVCRAQYQQGNIVIDTPDGFAPARVKAWRYND